MNGNKKDKSPLPPYGNDYLVSPILRNKNRKGITQKRIVHTYWDDFFISPEGAYYSTRRSL